MCRKYLYIIPLCLIFWPSAYAEGLRQEKPADSLLQERSVSGRVTDSERQPIPGAIITVVGTPRGVITDVDGTYEIVINNGEKLEFSAIGMASQVIAAEPGKRIDVLLLPKAEELENVTVVARSEEHTFELQSLMHISYAVFC